ncbi:hypothetical protein TIFTF001_039455 [Ficus carica]|uniref:Uncharacterized protein n=1 Tax=Ficus carica TaxID=3494 RepID=A0AA88JB28_FICCA|nr:hypothetical protein TIFTF001_039455 [Ficus carica]
MAALSVLLLSDHLSLPDLYYIHFSFPGILKAVKLRHCVEEKKRIQLPAGQPRSAAGK